MKRIIPFICAACLLVSCGNEKVSVRLPKDFATITEMAADYPELQDALKTTENADGSVSYELDESKQEALLEKVRQEFEKKKSELIGSTEMPNVTDIIANKDFSQITVKTKSEKLQITEKLLHIALYSYCELYAAFSGKEKMNYAIEVVNEKTGNSLKKWTSDDIKELKDKVDAKVSDLGNKLDSIGNQIGDQIGELKDKLTK